jgi:acetyl-CoA C-acetyltransferase
MRAAYIVTPVRTPVGKYLGSLADVPAERLAENVIRAVVDRGRPSD